MEVYKIGSRGDMVKRIQEVVGATPVDGVFGPVTKAKVVMWQKIHGLTADGIVGRITLAAMGLAGAESFVLTQQQRQKSRTITHLFVHCTASEQNTTPEQLMHYFIYTKKWSRPGYHYVVSADGTVTQMWTESKYSNGVKGMNMNSINIAWIGGVNKKHPDGFDNRTTAQKLALRAVLKELRRKYPKAKIMGHRDTSPDLNHNGIVDPWERIKWCPCFDAMVEYKDI